ncbi:MAG: methylenetetrahydrofolate reductase, partial [Bdellovibrionota bacterium]
MTRFGPKADRKITELLSAGGFTLSAEIIPPRNGADPESIIRQVESLTNAGSQFLAVTKGAGGSLRGGSLPIAQMIKDSFQTPCIAHFTCRDLLPEEVENQLIDHHFFGIRNILALRGDPPVGLEGWQPREGSYPYAYQLVEQLQALNQGRYLDRPGFKATERVKMDFCVGVACYPDSENPKER